MSVLADAPRTKRRQAGFDHVIQRARTHLIASPRQALSAANEAVLWAVNDASTARLMERFCAHLETGLGPAAAMRLGQVELRREYPHPYYWPKVLRNGKRALVVLLLGLLLATPLIDLLTE